MVNKCRLMIGQFIPNEKIKSPFMKKVIRLKEIWRRIKRSKERVENLLDDGNFVMISFLYSKNQVYNSLEGFPKSYKRHLALIIDQTDTEFIIKDTRPNKEGSDLIYINKEKLIFLSKSIEIFKMNV